MSNMTISKAETTPKEYSAVFNQIVKNIKAAQARAMTAVNKELVQVYRGIGQTIFEQQRDTNWGDSVVEQLALDLQKTFPGMRGFSSRNLWLMKDFYDSYRENEKLQTLSAEISWSHNVAILAKCSDPLEREFYIRMSKRNGWTYRVLQHQIENKTFEKTLISQSNFDKHIPEKILPEAKLAVKDEYAFEFLELTEEHSEYELEKAILRNIELFLKEVGNVYAFMGSLYRLEVGGQEFFIDLLLYNRKLKAMVAVELKVGSFMPEYVGKMQFYLAVLNDKIKLEDENPAIGIILCKEKNRTVVEYALKETNRPINVAAYKITEELPKELKKELPSPDQIVKLLDFIN